jgi:hypothetical protein
MRGSEAEVGREDLRAHRELLTVPTREAAYGEVDPLSALVKEEALSRAAAAATAGGYDKGSFAARLQRQVNLLVSIISGGSNETLTKAAYRPSYFLDANKERAGNREAVLKTWAHDKTYFVTNEPVNTNQIIHLHPDFERGGRDGLPNKVKGMWMYLYDHHVRDSNWIMKGECGEREKGNACMHISSPLLSFWHCKTDKQNEATPCFISRKKSMSGCVYSREISDTYRRDSCV